MKPPTASPGNTNGPPDWLVWNQLYDNRQFLFLFAKQTNNPNQSNRRSMAQWYFPLIPWLDYKIHQYKWNWSVYGQVTKIRLGRQTRVYYNIKNVHCTKKSFIKQVTCLIIFSKTCVPWGTWPIRSIWIFSTRSSSAASHRRWGTGGSVV